MKISCLVALFITIFASAACSAADKVDVRKIAGTLASRDPAAAQAAADRLTGLGPGAAAAVPQLTAALTSSDAQLRWRAARALENIGPAARTAEPALVKALQDKDGNVRSHAAHALGLVGNNSEGTIKALSARVTDPDGAVRKAAISALAKLKPDPKLSIPLLVKALEDADPAVVVSALETLAEGGPASLPALIEALHHEQGRYWACLVIAEMGPQAKGAVPELIKLLADPEPEVRMQVILALGAIGPDAKPAVASLISAVADSAAAVRYAAAFSLGRIGDAEAVPALEKAEDDQDAFLAMVAAWAIARLKPADKPAVTKAVDLIVAALKNDDANVRRGAAKALLELNAPPEVVGPPLMAALDDAHPAVQENVYDALASLGAAAVPRIIERLKDPQTHDKAVRLLRMIGAPAKAAAPELAAALDGADAAGKRELLYTLASIGPDAASAVPAVAKLISDADEEVQTAACFALGKIGPAAQAVVPDLRKNLDSPDRILRLVSIWALLRIQPGDAKIVQLAVPLLTKALGDAESELARTEAAAALGDIGAPARSAVPALKTALADDSPAVRSAAAAAIEKIGK